MRTFKFSSPYPWWLNLALAIWGLLALLCCWLLLLLYLLRYCCRWCRHRQYAAGVSHRRLRFLCLFHCCSFLGKVSSRSIFWWWWRGKRWTNCLCCTRSFCFRSVTTCATVRAQWWERDLRNSNTSGDLRSSQSSICRRFRIVFGRRNESRQ